MEEAEVADVGFLVAMLHSRGRLAMSGLLRHIARGNAVGTDKDNRHIGSSGKRSQHKSRCMTYLPTAHKLLRLALKLLYPDPLPLSRQTIPCLCRHHFFIFMM